MQAFLNSAATFLQEGKTSIVRIESSLLHFIMHKFTSGLP